MCEDIVGTYPGTGDGVVGFPAFRVPVTDFRFSQRLGGPFSPIHPTQRLAPADMRSNMLEHDA